MVKIKKQSFAGEQIFCGIDVHKKSWRVNIRCREFELEDFSQDACLETLTNHLNKKYPGAVMKVAYEAGFCGFGIERSLKGLGIDCIVVNAADIPVTDKELRRKQDKIDARKICRHLSAGTLCGVYVPVKQKEHARSLVRQRSRLVQDQTRCKNRIWQLLMFSGIELEVSREKQYWSRGFIRKLQELNCESSTLRQTLDLAIEEFLEVRKMLLRATLMVQHLSITEEFASTQRLLRSIPGIGLVNAMVIHTELQDISRFKTLDKLCSYVGIVPDSQSSGERQCIKGMTHRNNNYLRPAIVESSWVIIRRDPAMLMKYKLYCKSMPPNKAIIKISRHLLSRIRYVWSNQKEYVTGVVG